MATLIERVGRQALYTFMNRSTMTCEKFEENFQKLRSMADQLTAADVNFSLDNLHRTGKKDRNSPVTYVSVYEDGYVTIGIFVLKPGERLPLHDHPQMYGILKVIAGTVKIQSYTVVDSMPLNGVLYLSAVKLPEVVVSEDSNLCYLTPEECNLHEIRSVGGAAAFLDILAPPYSGEEGGGVHVCHYFKEEANSGDNNDLTMLVSIPSPPDYWTDTALYDGPRIRDLHLNGRNRT